MSRLSIVLALAVPAVVFVPLAMAQEAKKPKPAAAAPAPAADKPTERNDPENVVAISQTMEAVAKGIEKYQAKDFTAAIDQFKKAAQLNPKHPLGSYLLAETFLTQGNFPEAEAAINQALEGNAGKDHMLRSRVLFLAADIQERQKHWESAKNAWQAYTEHSSKFADAGFPATGNERMKVVARMLDLDRSYAQVRERIASEKADAGKPAPKK